MEKEALGRLSGLLRIVLAPEKLDELPQVPAGRTRTPLLGLLIAREELPKDIIAPAGKGNLISWLLRPEHLPFDPPVATSGRASFLGLLLSRERLPEDPAPAAGEGKTRGGRA